jgi:succinate dehydrogenase/fumarate reductase-like Fe-S protein
MSETHTKGEMHGCIVCGKLYELYLVYDEHDKFVGAKVMSAGGKLVRDKEHILVACEHHSGDQIEGALERVFGEHVREDPLD